MCCDSASFSRPLDPQAQCSMTNSFFWPSLTLWMTPVRISTGPDAPGSQRPPVACAHSGRWVRRLTPFLSHLGLPRSPEEMLDFSDGHVELETKTLFSREQSQKTIHNCLHQIALPMQHMVANSSHRQLRPQLRQSLTSLLKIVASSSQSPLRQWKRCDEHPN